MLFPLTFFAGAELVRLSRAAGFTISGHCAHPLPLVVAGITGQEDLDGQCRGRSGSTIHQDQIGLYSGAGVWGVPTIYLHGAHARAVRNRAPGSALPPFVTPRLRLVMLRNPPEEQVAKLRDLQGENARLGTRLAHTAKLLLAAGGDAPEFPDALHGELEELVAAGLTPLEALRTATSDAARMLGIERDVGSLAEGKLADLVLLDADPIVDIRNVRRIWKVIQGGRVVDRDRLRQDAANGR